MTIRQGKFSRALAITSACTLFLLLGWVGASNAQQSDPTKTPSPTPTATAELTSTPAPVAAAPFEPFTQSNLTVLTGNVQRPNGITWLDGKLYVACSGDWTIYEIGAEDARTITYAGGVRNAHMLYAEPSETLPVIWAPDFQQNTFVRVVRGASDVIVDGLNGPWGVAYVDEESFLVTNLLGGTLVRITREGEVETLLNELASPTGIAMNDEHVFIANNGSARRAVEWFSGDVVDGEPSEQGTLISGLQSATGLALDDQGMLYVAYSLGTRGVVGRVDPQDCMERGGCANTDVEIVLYTELAAPLAGLTISPDRRLYVHTMFAPDIYWLQLPS